MNRILVTGGAGFIGSHTVDLLLEKNFNVIVYDNFSTGKLTNLHLFDSRLEVIQGDILDYSKLTKEMARCDAVLHLAAITSVLKSIEDPVQSLQVNVQGFLNILQAMRELNKSIRLVYASSAAVYGNVEELPCCDDVSLMSYAMSPYALDKANDERYAALYEKLFSIKSLGLRYFNVYGTRQDPKSPYSGVISKFIEQFQKKEPLKVFGDGEQSRDFIHVSDVARANVLALESDFSGILNIATGVAHTLKKLIHFIEQAGGHSVEVEFTAPRMGDILKSYGSVERALQSLDFQAQVSLAEGMRLTMVL